MDSTVWLPIATLIGGATLAFIGEWLRDKRQHRRDLLMNELQYARDGRRRHRDWQRQVTTDLLNELNALYIAVDAYSDGMKKEFRETGVWRDPDDSTPLPDEFPQLLARISTLLALIADTQLSNDIGEMQRPIMGPIWVATEKEATTTAGTALGAHVEATRQLGAYARLLSTDAPMRRTVAPAPPDPVGTQTPS